ncbi:hypothetical protein CERZMDRAFT_94853 [Cercospora zeae-maydis SCOH1-5]|uniref:Uncharacterized protein n=1 Tax=Cercospora zeae-maydis SCOH1-5 TaxID=717836 RepID=A0A6A6FPQ9_9PEZI|nr:hypothetical protein CERZMDRAFT_94853 [Cercospora zeae-maydis SCOH1-5]
MAGLTPAEQRFQQIHPDHQPTPIHKTGSKANEKPEKSTTTTKNTTTTTTSKKPSRPVDSYPPVVRKLTAKNPTALTHGHLDAIIRDPFHLSPSSSSSSAAHYSASYSRVYAKGSLFGTPAQRPPSMPLSALKSAGPRCHDEWKCDLHAKGFTAQQVLILARDELEARLQEEALEEAMAEEAARASREAEGGEGNRWVDLGNGSTVIRAR